MTLLKGRPSWVPRVELEAQVLQTHRPLYSQLYAHTFCGANAIGMTCNFHHPPPAPSTRAAVPAPLSRPVPRGAAQQQKQPPTHRAPPEQPQPVTRPTPLQIPTAPTMHALTGNSPFTAQQPQPVQGQSFVLHPRQPGLVESRPHATPVPHYRGVTQTPTPFDALFPQSAPHVRPCSADDCFSCRSAELAGVSMPAQSSVY